MPFETNLKKLGLLARKREDMDFRFRRRLKESRLPREKIDAVVLESFKRYSELIDCKKCGNCCEQFNTTFTDEDIDRLSKILNLSSEEFKAKYLKMDELRRELITKEKPCPFYQNHLCSVYENRPQVCREYPHIDKPNFVTRTMGVIANCAICPIVYYVYDEIKIGIDYLEHEHDDDWFSRGTNRKNE